MNFDEFTIVMLIKRADAPKMVESEENSLQDAQLAFLSKLHQEGHLLAAGPTGPDDDKLRGVCIFRGSPEEVKVLMQKDPWFGAGRDLHENHSCAVPSGVISFPKGHLPASMLEVEF